MFSEPSVLVTIKDKPQGTFWFSYEAVVSMLGCCYGQDVVMYFQAHGVIETSWAIYRLHEVNV